MLFFSSLAVVVVFVVVVVVDDDDGDDDDVAAVVVVDVVVVVVFFSYALCLISLEVCYLHISNDCITSCGLLVSDEYQLMQISASQCDDGNTGLLYTWLTSPFVAL